MREIREEFIEFNQKISKRINLYKKYGLKLLMIF
jgi:hypothetical protein